MSVCTKGFVVTRNKSVFHAIALVESALNERIGSLMATLQANRGRDHSDPYLRRVRISLDTSSRGADLNFTYEGEHRQLTMHFECDCDVQKHLDSAKSGITLMMGCTGRSELFMKTALNALASLGPVYYILSDCSDKPYEKLDIPTMSYLEACRQHLVLPSCVSLRQWLAEFQTGTLAGATEVEALGLDLDEAHRIIAMNYDDSAARLKVLANMVEDETTVEAIGNDLE